MKKIRLILFLFLAGTAASCIRQQPDSAGGITLLLSTAPETATKSQYSESALNALREIWVLGLCDNGYWSTAYFREDELRRNGTAFQCPPMTFLSGTHVTFFIAANMGNLTDAVRATLLPDGTPRMADLEYLLPDPVNLAQSAMPMAGTTSVTLSAAQTGISVPALLIPLLAQLSIAIQKCGIYGDAATVDLASRELKIKQANRRLRPFGLSAATTAGDLFSIDIDKESFSTAECYDRTHTDIVLYVPENAMGDLLAADSSQWEKGNEPVSGKSLCTYIEYNCTKDAGEDGLSGELAYRAYLGSDATRNFSVLRGCNYSCTLDLSWNGLFFEGDWRIDNSDIRDGRILTLSDTPCTVSGSYTDMGDVRKTFPRTLYVNFSRDGGSSWVQAAKDIDTWPYGWDLYVDGVKQCQGTSASASGDLGWTYTSADSCDLIGLCPGQTAITGERHTLQVKSADGRIASNIVSFTTSEEDLRDVTFSNFPSVFRGSGCEYTGIIQPRRNGVNDNTIPYYLEIDSMSLANAEATCFKINDNREEILTGRQSVTISALYAAEFPKDVTVNVRAAEDGALLGSITFSVDGSGLYYYHLDTRSINDVNWAEVDIFIKTGSTDKLIPVLYRYNMTERNYGVYTYVFEQPVSRLDFTNIICPAEDCTFNVTVSQANEPTSISSSVSSKYLYPNLYLSEPLSQNTYGNNFFVRWDTGLANGSTIHIAFEPL